MNWGKYNRHILLYSLEVYCIFESIYGFYFAKNLENIFKIVLVIYFGAYTSLRLK